MRMITETCCDWAPSFRETVRVAVLAASFTETGSRAKFVPAGWGKSLAVRPRSVAEANPGGQVMRRVSPSFTDFGETVHFCGSDGAAETAQAIRGSTARRNESETIETQGVIDL